LRFLFEDSALATAAHPSIPMLLFHPKNKMERGGEAYMDEEESREQPQEEHSRDAA
jgi:hypothetical protein